MSVILYARVSTGDQAEKDLSIPAQLRACRQLAKSEGWLIAGEYQDVSSGRSFCDRPGLTAAIKQAVKSGDVKALVVHRLDRLARNLYDHLVIKWCATQTPQCDEKTTGYRRSSGWKQTIWKRMPDKQVTTSYTAVAGGVILINLKSTIGIPKCSKHFSIVCF